MPRGPALRRRRPAPRRRRRCCASRRSTTPTAARPPTRSCASPPTSRATPEVVVEGPDFVSDPRWRPDGGAFCWLEWDHPDMPWDATRLVVDDGGAPHGGGRRRRAGVDRPADVGARRRRSGSSATAPGSGASTGGRRTAASRPMVDLGTDIGFPQWVFGQSLLRVPRRRPGRVRVLRRRARAAGGARARRGRVTTLDVPYTLDRPACARAATAPCASPPAPTDRAARRRRSTSTRGAVDVRRAAARPRPRRRVVLRRPSRSTFPTAGGATAHALLLPADQPRRATAPDGERPPLLVMIHGGPTAAARPMLQLSPPVLDEPRLRGRRRQLPRLHRLRPRLPRPAARRSGASPTSRTAPPCARYLVERGDVDPDRLCIRGGSRRRLHHARRAHVPRRVRGRRQPLRRRRPRRAGRGDPQVREPLPRRAGRPVARGPATSTRSARRSSTPTASTGPLVVFQGLDDPIVPPNQAEMIVDALRAKGVPVAYLAVRGRAARVPPGARTSGPPSTASSASTPRSSASTSPRPRASSRSRSRTSEPTSV